MKIISCLKRVPDTEARLKIAGGAGIDTAGVKFVISPYDEYALEAGFRLRDGQGGGEVVAVTVGEPAAAEQLRSAPSRCSATARIFDMVYSTFASSCSSRTSSGTASLPCPTIRPAGRSGGGASSFTLMRLSPSCASFSSSGFFFAAMMPLSDG